MTSNWIQRHVVDYQINFLSSSSYSAFQESVLEIGANRSRKIARIDAVAEENWEEFDGKIHSLHFEETEMANSFPVFKLREPQS